MNRPKVVIFENIEPISVPFVTYYLKSGYEVRYYKVNVNLANSKIFQNMSKNNKLSKIINLDFDLNKTYLPHRMALKAVESVYKIFSNRGKLIGLTEKRIGSNKIHLFYKKILTEKLYNYYFLRSYMDRFTKENSFSGRIIFWPSETVEIVKLLNLANEPCDLAKGVEIPFWSKIVCLITKFFVKTRMAIFMILLPARIILKVLKKESSRDQPFQHYQVGIRVYSTDWGFHLKYRTIDFLLDGEKLKPNNTLFCIEGKISDEYINKLREKGYNCVEMIKIFEKADWNFVNKVILKESLLDSFAYTLFFAFEPQVICEAAYRAMRGYLIWTCFLRHYHVKNFVAYNNFHPEHIIRNILLSQKGARTWYYVHTCNDTGIIAPSANGIDLRDFTFSFMYFDTLVSWGDRMKRYYSSHKNQISNYKSLGCLWSEHIRIVKENGSSTIFKDKVIRKIGNKPNKILSIFDTTFGGHESLLNKDDLCAFMNGIAKTLDTHPDIVLVLKKKWRWAYLLENRPGIGEIYEKLQKHPRCYSTDNDERDPADAIAISDLVVSMCFTSPTVEALAAGQKAIYFDGLGRLKGYYYDQFPNLVAHGIDELLKLVDYWFGMPSGEFNQYLQEHVKGEIDAFVDGRAITRFRQELIA